MQKALLLENIHPLAVSNLKARGFEVATVGGALDEDELISKLADVSVLGIRSKTHVTDRVLANAPQLEAVGAFSIGTNQIDLPAAAERGIAVFNAPYSNTRSVVELVIGELIMLVRHIPEKDRMAHRGIWDKAATGSHEVRHRTLGIIGYGNIGAQLSVVAEALGMKVVFYDLEEKLAMGNAERRHTLNELLEESDVVTLHVDGRKSNTNFFGTEQFAAMKDGAMFINNSRGHVVDIEALYDAVKSGHVGGAAIDVYPAEPKKRGDAFETKLAEFDNVILTPHIGGSTEEAQRNIGRFVSGKLIDYIKHGDTSLSVNLPVLTLPWTDGIHRIAHVHRNIPGVLAKVNNTLSDLGVNIDSQVLATRGQIGYAVTDVNAWVEEEVLEVLRGMDETIRLRIMG
ncbi:MULTISPECIES: phosphoglycerate dehydrogenase [unclassified Pseudoclavibacter]|uniref:phosphoglycerate dehydrogenase n=1 Tax=unclassified Pseudoclavibacter TaxID=2615177 RepID=UPI0013016F9A|nr:MULTISPECIES: phosphoglycerate dehydrogenase [unclassified Pseudoclavibacter]KAB1645643.1 phosphoglycerate dehydrogenase [Pseudoclavibacter sp. CFCC 14310]KAB1664450.1 phosphoglycerate dehydrogenase [Pseudoclavibacter sp. CFCC 13611]